MGTLYIYGIAILCEQFASERVSLSVCVCVRELAIMLIHLVSLTLIAQMNAKNELAAHIYWPHALPDWYADFSGER